jgi:hypothetical protein
LITFFLEKQALHTLPRPLQMEPREIVSLLAPDHSFRNIDVTVRHRLALSFNDSTSAWRTNQLMA